MTTTLKENFDDLILKKLVRKKDYKDLGLSVYKYNNTVFFKNLWHKSRYLLKARGIVLDEAGGIVVHPFDKVFNFNENGTGSSILPTQKVVAVEKYNGFLGCISLHPNKTDIIASTTGSLDSDFVGYIHDLISPDLKTRLLNYLSTHNETLMFEVIHPSDPHIIEYEAKDQGLWLIGSRERVDNSDLKTESELDAVASVLKLPRPQHFETTFEDVLDRLKKDKIEGYMVRDINTQEVLLKGKTNFYLTTKFLGRMGRVNIDMMYDNTSVFKQKVEEEFFELVDTITTQFTKEQLLGMNNLDKVNAVRGMIETLNTQRAQNVAPPTTDENAGVKNVAPKTVVMGGVKF